MRHAFHVMCFYFLLLRYVFLFSPSAMESFVDVAQLLISDVSVDLSGSYRRMTKHCLDTPDIRSVY